MTKKTYNIEAKGVIKLWMEVDASSQEEAEALAEKCTERYYGEPGPWRPIADGYNLEITSVREEKSSITKEEVEASLKTPMYYEEEEEEETPPKVIDIPKRDFIPGWDD